MKLPSSFLTILFLWLPSYLSAAERTKVAFLGGFSSLSTSTVLTDLNLEKGLKVFQKLHPKATKSLEFVRFDNQGEASATALEVKKIADQGIRFIIGVSKSNHALVVAPLADENKILFITPQATNDRVTQNHPYVFRTCFSDWYQGQAVAKFALENKKAKRILVLTNVDAPYSVGLSGRFQDVVGKKAALTEWKYAPDTMDLTELRKVVAKSSPDLVFIPDYVNTAVVLIKELYQLNPKLILVGGDGWGGREVLDPAIAPLKDLNAFYTTLWSRDISTPKNKVFLDALSSLYPHDFSSVSPALMYDALSIFWEAYQSARAPKTPESIRAVLLAKAFSTTSGTVRFPDPNNPTPSKKVVINRLNAGKHEFYESY